MKPTVSPDVRNPAQANRWGCVASNMWASCKNITLSLSLYSMSVWRQTAANDIAIRWQMQTQLGRGKNKRKWNLSSMLIALVPTNLNMTQTMSREYWGRKIYMKREPWNRSHLMVGNRTAPTRRNRNGWTRQTIYTSMNSKRLTRCKSHTNQKIDIWKWKINSTAECFEFQYW